MNLDDFLLSALKQQLRSTTRKSGRRRISDAAEDYANRLSEKALYRRLINDTNIAQDGIRFVFWFGRQTGMSLDEWRAYIDKKMREAKERKELCRDSSKDGSLLNRDMASKNSL